MAADDIALLAVLGAVVLWLGYKTETDRARRLARRKETTMAQHNEPMSLEDFAAKVDHEGGILCALMQGVKPEDAPEGALRDEWRFVSALHDVMAPSIDRINAILDAARDGDGTHDTAS